MDFPASVAQAAAVGVCAIHPVRSAAGTCTRCGSFFCDDCHKTIAGRQLCAACLRIPGVDYLREIRDRYWGKRDGWVWYLGVVGSLSGVSATLQGLATQDWLRLALGLGQLSVSVPYLMLRPWARRWLFAWVPLTGLVTALSFNDPNLVPTPGAQAGVPLVVGISSSVMIALFVLAAYADPRNKLAFRVELGEMELQKLYGRYANASASRAFFYGLLSFVVPLLGIVSLALGLRGRSIANRDAWPPAGGYTRAAWGIGLSVASLLLWGGVFAVALLR